MSVGLSCGHLVRGVCWKCASETRSATIVRVEALADELYAALKSYYQECGCKQTKMDAVNQAAYAALRKYENWNGR